ncbi:MAG: aminopeptidase P N-terminal domain-containing protein [Armatimonadetes bacterium]|nr:aminopeptidase P N-terminal domain-containing protein [Armatimonadota bacterium]
MIASIACLALLAQQQDGFQFRVYENDKIKPAEFAQRRHDLLAKLPAGNVTVLVTNPLHQRSNDTEYRFRPNSYFWYLTGCEEGDSALILAPDGITVDGKSVKEVLFVQDKNPGAETWTGILMGAPVAKELLGIDAVVSNKRFAEVLSTLHPESTTLVDRPEGLSGTVQKMVESFDQWSKGTKADATAIKTLNVMRSVKSPAEIALTWKSINATVEAHKEALRSCEPGMREYEIASLVEYIFARNGCESVAYGSIVGSGVNSCVLHYVDARKTIEKGDFICMDVGGEYHGYASDVTRSYPANGKYTPEQRAIYEIVQEAQEAGVKACKVGAAFGAAGQVANRIVADGLMKLGIIKEASEVRRYFMHGTSHYVGLDVHDTGDYGPLRNGQIMTVEPGIYIKEGSPCDKKWWNIGVRIEDTILVTDAGPVNMSGSKLPRSIPEIEKLMSETGLGNRPEGKVISEAFKGSLR